MSLAARLFENLHRARFYRDLHAEAAALAGRGEGRGADGAAGLWLDVGSGPGLVARLAAVNGWEAVAIDPDPAMVVRAAAAAEAARRDDGRSFSTRLAGLEDLSRFGPAEAVSAASLLFGFAPLVANVEAGEGGLDRAPDRALARPAALDHLVAAVAPGGACLVVETTEAMTLPRALAHLARIGWGKGGWLLVLWALARRGARHLSDDDFTRPGWVVTRHDLLDGMVAARLMRRAE